MNELTRRVNFADELHKSKDLSKLIQRKLKDSRGKEICEYLEQENERFLSSLVVAVYGGEPVWLPADIRPSSNDINKENISEDALNTVGFLRLSGDEHLFALDGQHRLAGMKEAMKRKIKDLEDEELSVILVAHKNDQSGLERTRRLFTTLNKKAIPVRKGEIIALDENDMMAIICRRLLESSELFNDRRIAIKTTNNLNKKDKYALTTIGNLYDLLTILFGKIYNKKSVKDLKNLRRMSGEEQDYYYEYAEKFFRSLINAFPPLSEYFSSKNEDKVVEKYRCEDTGGHLLFRPIGLSLILEVVSELIQSGESIESSLDKIENLPMKLNEEPYVDMLWNSERKTMQTRPKVAIRDKFLLDLKVNKFVKKRDKILEKYNSYKNSSV